LQRELQVQIEHTSSSTKESVSTQSRKIKNL